MKLFSRSMIAKSALVWTACVALAAPVCSQEAPGPSVSSWFVGARQGIIASNRDLRHDGDITSLHLGRRFGATGAYEIEVEIAQDRLDFGIDYGLKHRSAQFNLMLVNREPLWNPYFLIGMGAIEFDSPVGERQGIDPLLALGFGGTWELVVPQRVLLRADLRIRYDFEDTGQAGEDSRGEGIFSVGLVVPFGSSY